MLLLQRAFTAALCIVPARTALLSSAARYWDPPHPATLPIDVLRKDVTVTHTRAVRCKVQTNAARARRCIG